MEELRQCNIDVTLPNSFSIKEQFSESSLLVVREIKNLLLLNNFLIIRDFSVKSDHAMILARLLSDKIFYQGDDLKYNYQFEGAPFQTEILSTSLSCGDFHTDFWSISDVPNYILLQCISPDPKHPFYSRNQVVSVSSLLEKLNLLSNNIMPILDNVSLPYVVKNKIRQIKLLNFHEGKIMIRLHPKYVEENLLEKQHYIDGIPIHHLISDIVQSIADDFVLNASDVLIVSNKFCLHRRGESTVVFDKTFTQWKGRILNTLRFF
jgi:hypothetical protein